MTQIANPGLLIAGIVLALIGIWLWRRAGRYDLKDAVIDSAWETVRGRRSADNPTAIEKKLREIGDAPDMTGRAKKAASAVAGHVWAQVLSVTGIVSLLAGLALAAAGVFWR